MNRQQRRAQMKAAPKPKKKPIYHNLTVEQKKEALFRNGITDKDLKQAYEDGRKHALHDYTSFGQAMFYSSCAIALHNVFRFGESRIVRVLNEMYRIMIEELTEEDIIQRCKRETGIEIDIDDGYSPF